MIEFLSLGHKIRAVLINQDGKTENHFHGMMFKLLEIYFDTLIRLSERLNSASSISKIAPYSKERFQPVQFKTC